MTAESTEARDYKAAVGGMWDEIGQLQFDFLVQVGCLKPHHRLLDMGCGSLRGGVKFLPYLNGWNYFGIEKEQWLLDAAKKFVIPELLIDCNLACRDDFHAIAAFGREEAEFDFVLAQSLFTHLPPRDIGECMRQVRRVLKPKTGRFFATYFPNESSTSWLYNESRDVHSYRTEALEWLAEGAGLQSMNYGPWNHPRGQHMMVFADISLDAETTPIIPTAETMP